MELGNVDVRGQPQPEKNPGPSGRQPGQVGLRTLLCPLPREGVNSSTVCSFRSLGLTSSLSHFFSPTAKSCLEFLLVGLGAPPSIRGGAFNAPTDRDCPTPTHHQLGAPLQLQGLGSLLLQIQELLLPQKVLLGEELQLLGMVQGAAAGRVQGRPEGRHRSPLHQLRWG